MTFEDALKIRARIACPEHGYAQHEAEFVDTMEWEQHKKDSWARWRDAMLESFTNGENIW